MFVRRRGQGHARCCEGGRQVRGKLAREDVDCAGIRGGHGEGGGEAEAGEGGEEDVDLGAWLVFFRGWCRAGFFLVMEEGGRWRCFFILFRRGR